LPTNKLDVKLKPQILLKDGNHKYKLEKLKYPKSMVIENHEGKLIFKKEPAYVSL
jgi:hypothetical protein